MNNINNWDANDWQGRTKEQVESSYQMAGWAFIGIIFLIALSFIF